MKNYINRLIWKSNYYNPIEDRNKALKFAKIRNKKILDMGTGKGYVAILAAKNFNCDVTTIDISKEKIKIAKENAKKEKVFDKIKFKEGNAIKTPFLKNSFDAVISFNALHHTKKNFKKVIAEMFRVSKNKVIITELNGTGAKIFDKYIHPKENHQAMILNLNDLRNFLKQYSDTIKIFKRRLMNTFVCEKLMGRKK